MSNLERLGIEFIAVALLMGGALIWWNVHNAGERKAGAAACVAATTETKQTVVARDTSDETAQAGELKTAVATYDAKVKSLSADNDDLARRLRDANAVRPSAVPSARCPAATAAADAGLPAGKSEADQRLADTVAVLNACDANQVKTEAIAKAYNDWRDRMIRENDGRHLTPVQLPSGTNPGR
jgi:hypothetical protein